MPSDMDMGDGDLDGGHAADAAGELDAGHYVVREQADEHSAESPDQYQKRMALQQKLSA